MFHGSNPYRKDNPRWVISNAMETMRVPVAGPQSLAVAVCVWDHSGLMQAGGLAGNVTGRIRSACEICAAWVIGLPRRMGAWLHAASDAEAGWWSWQVTERYGGLGRRYRDARFEAARHDPSLRRGDLEL